MPAGIVGPIIKTPSEQGVAEKSLPLTCVACGKTAVYDVGTIMMHPRVIRNIDPRSPEACFASLAKADLKDSVYFSGYFTCEFCGSGDDWDLPRKASQILASLVLEDILSDGNGDIVFGLPKLYDGTLAVTSYDAVEYLKKKIKADPQNGFLWSRLGNAYVCGNRGELSGPAFEKSVELDPNDPETHHSLGEYWRKTGDDVKAARSYHMLMRKCHTGKWYRTDICLELMVGMVDELWQMQLKSRGAIQVFPPAEDDEPFPEAERLQRFAIAYPDLSTPHARQQLACALLEGKPRSLHHRHSIWQEKALPKNSPKAKLQDRRQRPCPCRSGMKYCKCCGKR